MSADVGGEPTAVILAARIGPSHDGLAELVVEVGARGEVATTLSLEEGAAFACVEAAGVGDITELVGLPWQMVLGGFDRVARLSAGK